MYESFYGLKEKPFNLTPDPEYFYLSQNHKNAYAHLEYAVSENKGFVVITGEIGSGKTTLIRYLLSNVGVDVNVGLINNTYLFPRQILKLICKEFELNINRVGPFDLQEVFYGFLLNEYAHKRRVVLIVDEAQNLSLENLEEIRLLSNLESEKNHLLQIVLVGQPGLKDNLNRKGLEQFTQRVSVTYHLGRMSMKDAATYISYRLQKAGARGNGIFRIEAIKAIYQHSRGIPRVINILCDTALLYGYAEGQKEIGEKLIMSIINDRKRSGIYNSEQETKASQKTEGPRTEAHVNTEIERRIAQTEQRLKLIEEHLVQLNRNMEISVRNEAHSLEALKSLKGSLNHLMNAVQPSREESSLEGNKQAKKWTSFFGVTRVK